MTDSEFKQAEEILHAIQNEPTMNRIFCETPYYEMGGDFIVFQLRDIVWKLELTIASKADVKKAEKLSGKDARKLFSKPKNTKL